MNVEIGTEAAQFLEKEYINEIFLAVCSIQDVRNASARRHRVMLRVYCTVHISGTNVCQIPYLASMYSTVPRIDPTPSYLVVYSILKGQCHEIFDFRFFFHESVSPQAPEYPIRTVSNFFDYSRRYSQLQSEKQSDSVSIICHRCC
jgi:hypothetical protein